MKFIFKHQLGIFIFIYILFIKASIAQAPLTKNFWIVWNVGQGQWVSHVINDECRHYDFGGESQFFHRIKNKLTQHCSESTNLLFLSHWDTDHYLNIFNLVKVIPNTCVANFPPFNANHLQLKKINSLKLKKCLLTKIQNLSIWHPSQNNQRRLSKNDLSDIFQDESFLIPGDSPIKQEVQWVKKIKNPLQIKILILGHHGSRTSTGQNLLKKFKNINQAIASARYLKYQHPHTETVQRLKKFHISLLKTEDWGNIYLNSY